jgi:PDZ domain-containing protein
VKYSGQYSGGDENGGRGYFRLKPAGKWLLFTFVTAYLFFWLPTPYVVFQPGSAEAVRPMVQVQNGDAAQKGSFLLTTVRMTYSNVASLLLAQIDPYAQVQKKSSVFMDGESPQEYSVRQEYVMLTSQSNAIQAAYNEANIPYEIQTAGVMVVQIVDGMPAAEVLRAGDQIVKLDEKPIRSRDEVLAFTAGKKAGDTVTVTYKRNGKEHTARLALAELPPENGGEPRAGLGIVPVDMQTIAVADDKKVTISAGDIGGPSAGLMFALEIYDRLVPGDITKGYTIAGTGTINPAGEVGVIGGVEHKVVAADRAGADIFFVPEDLYPAAHESFAPVLNASDAKRRAQEIGTAMEVVPVGTLEEALDYLESLPPKKETGA